MAKPLQSKVKGLPELVASLKKVKYAHGEGFADGVIAAAHFILGKSLEIVPTETLTLYHSGGVREKGGEGFNKIALVVFTAEYSIWVHERLDLLHGRAYNIRYAEDIAMGRKLMKRPDEQAKFIEMPLRKYRKDVLDIVRISMRERARQETLVFKMIRRGR